MATELLAPHDDTFPAGRPAGLLVAAASLLSLVFMVMHPTSHAPGPTALLNAVVHGTLIALSGALACGFTCLASRLGMRLILVRAGLVAYVMGTGAFIAAALINGFIVPQLLTRYGVTLHEVPETLGYILRLCREVNQTCSRMGVLADSAAILLWSMVLVRRPDPARSVGLLGGLAGAGPLLGVLLGQMAMNVHGMLAFVLCQTLWSLAVAALLMRGRI